MTHVFGIMFIAVASNHLGLVDAVEKAIKHELPIVNCARCFTFWATTAYLAFMRMHPICILTTAFLFAYLAIWLDLAMGVIDYYYTRLYDKIYGNTDNALTASAASSDAVDADRALSELQTKSDHGSHKKK